MELALPACLSSYHRTLILCECRAALKLTRPRLIGCPLSVAIAFAKRGANIYIAGRNAEAAEQVLSKAREAAFPDHSGAQVFKFYPFNAILVSACKRFAGEMVELFTARGGLDVLVMTQGMLANGERKETEEGHEWFVSPCGNGAGEFVCYLILGLTRVEQEPGIA